MRRTTSAAPAAVLTFALSLASALPSWSGATTTLWGLTRQDGVTVYQEPDTASHPLARVVHEGDRVELLQGEGAWYKVRVGAAQGWVPTEQVRVDFSAWQAAAAAASDTTKSASTPPAEVPAGAEAQVAVPPPDPAPSIATPPVTVVALSTTPSSEAAVEPPAEKPKTPAPVAAAPAVDPDAATTSPANLAPSTAETPVEPVLRGRWRAGVVLGYGFLDQEADASLGTTTSTLSLDRHRYAGVRVGYGVNEWLELELAAVYDWYRWDVDNSLSAKSSDFSAFTLTGGSLFYGPRRSYGWLGTGAFFAQGALAYRIPNADLDYPVSDYNPAFGAQLAVGYEWRALQFRLGYSHLRHRVGATEPGADLSDDADPLDLSEVFVDLTWSWRSDSMINGQ